MHAIPYDEKAWRPIPAGMPSQRLRDALQNIFINPRAVDQYATPQALNGLFTWATYDSAWRVKCFVLLNGLEAISARPRTSTEVANMLNMSKAAVWGHAMQKGLSRGHKLLVPAPNGRIRLENPFRKIGLPTRVWRPLAREHIFTLKQLCELRPHDITSMRGLSDKALSLIERQLTSVTRF